MSIKSFHQQICSVIGQQATNDTASGRLAHLVTIYAGIKPLLTAIVSLPFVPAKWRGALAIFVAALDAVTGDVNADFKAGKDL